MEPEGSFPHPQMPATCLYPKPDGSISYLHIPLSEYNNNNNNNNNNIYLLQLGCNPVADVMLHVYKT